MANLNMSYAKLDRLFNIPREFWSITKFSALATVPDCEYNEEYGWYTNIVRDEYRNNAHPHQEYLADLKMARVLIKQKLDEIVKTEILNEIDRAIEATTPLAIKEITSDYKVVGEI